MPTIEVISVQNKDGFVFDQNDYSFAIRQENILQSHRGLFSKYLQGFEGKMIHLGDSDFIGENGPPFFAGKLINWDFDSIDHQIILPMWTEGGKDEWNGSDQSDVYKNLEKIIIIMFSKLSEIQFNAPKLDCTFS
jgi:hypothetical protein